MSGRVTGWNIYMVLLNKKLFAVTNHFYKYINFIYISFALDFLLNLGYTATATPLNATPKTLLPIHTPLYGYSLIRYSQYTLLSTTTPKYATPKYATPKYATPLYATPYTHSIHHYFISITIYASQIK